MQNKKSLLQRMLVIYITFFVILAAGLAHSFLPNFSRGYNEGATMGGDIVRNWASGAPRQIFTLGEVSVTSQDTFVIKGLDSLSEVKITPTIQHINLTVDQPADSNVGAMSLAFSAIGGSAWIYLLTMLGSVAFLAIIVLMFIIIHSIRRSIKEERTLDSRNVWYIRTIGFLTIFTELSHALIAWCMATRAAELLAGSNLIVDTTFSISYYTIIMGILVIFTAEVFAIGQNLSEEQKLTI
ncbi:MAG: DUF2975 domain-containing protein [Alistipes sp.]